MNKINEHRRVLLLRLPVAALIVAAYGVSIFQDVFVFRGSWAFTSQDSVSGGILLLVGWLGILFGVIGWYANLLFIPGLVLFSIGKFQVSRWFALAALLVALSSLLLRALPNGGGLGVWDPIASFGLGLYAWLGSMIMLVVGTFIFQALSTSRLQPNPHDN